MNTWTKPYFGVQHLNGLPRGWQVTVSEYSPGFAQCWVRPEGAGFGGQTTNHESAAAARHHGERQVGLLLGSITQFEGRNAK